MKVLFRHSITNFLSGLLGFILSMVENYLSEEILDLILQKSCLAENQVDEPDVSINKPNDEEKNYIKERINVQLPNTTQSEKLQFIPPNLPPNNINSQNSTEPNFIRPEEHFNVFEHFQFTWIESPELENLQRGNSS